MSTNPFVDDTPSVLVLVTPEGQPGRWATVADDPAGWRAARSAANRAASPKRIDQNWPAM
ncbi:MbtH family protein [Mycolicibacterium sp. GF69]|uniref:MbtH family NRPS accessory protein n=1 Tax=Mycolicibacterium sp. GF69 TaxID=2267251 RepID=UPI000DCD397E|nr:MbtH family NRPS accessory protein [Mycolicibacterium sp. GF69]RAV13492.1 MbtH family protein [Mycolicibacterium sp. GF69]